MGNCVHVGSCGNQVKCVDSSCRFAGDKEYSDKVVCTSDYQSIGEF